MNNEEYRSELDKLTIQERYVTMPAEERAQWERFFEHKAHNKMLEKLASQKYEAEYETEKERILKEKKKNLIFNGVAIALNLLVILILLIKHYS